ncbi:hypothetical protein [Deinococcus depolymerans]|uniref:Lipoprotein n=1 Tax=Deinococcus depolymerans TaxID=392408 RepID=A0ABN1BHK2_9DEIO
MRRTPIRSLTLQSATRPARLLPLLASAALFAGCGAPAQGLASLSATGPVMAGRLDVPGTYEQVCSSLEEAGWSLLAVSFQDGKRRYLYLLPGPDGRVQYALVSGTSPVQLEMYAGRPALGQSATAD